MRTKRNISGLLLAMAIGALPWTAQAAQPLGCLIEPHRVAEIGSQVIGVIEAVHVERGDRVRRGQTLATLRGDVERAAVSVAATKAQVDAEVNAAAANHELARQKHARARGLMEQNFISQQALELARAEFDVAEQRLAQARAQRRIWARELELAEAQLAMRTIRSPSDGVIVERYLSVGERIEEKPIVRLATVDPLRVEVVVPAVLFGAVRLGAALSVTPELPNALPRPAKVVLVDSVIDGPSNTFRVRLELPNPDQSLPAGLRCRVELGGPAEQVAPAREPGAPAMRPALHVLGADLPLRPSTSVSDRELPKVAKP